MSCLGDVYRFDVDDPEQGIRQFNMDAQDDEAAILASEYVLNMWPVRLSEPTGRLYRIDHGTDEFVAIVGPIEVPR